MLTWFHVTKKNISTIGRRRTRRSSRWRWPADFNQGRNEKDEESEDGKEAILKDKRKMIPPTSHRRRLPETKPPPPEKRNTTPEKKEEQIGLSLQICGEEKRDERKWGSFLGKKG